jgi:hypothetical protein
MQPAGVEQGLQLGEDVVEDDLIANAHHALQLVVDRPRELCGAFHDRVHVRDLVRTVGDEGRGERPARGVAARGGLVVPAIGIATASTVATTADGGFVVAGQALEDLRTRRGRVWRFDGAGRAVWQQAYGDGEPLVRGVAALPDGGAVVVGATQASGATLRPRIFGVDRQGAQRWTAR